MIHVDLHAFSTIFCDSRSAHHDPFVIDNDMLTQNKRETEKNRGSHKDQLVFVLAWWERGLNERSDFFVLTQKCNLRGKNAVNVCGLRSDNFAES
jgi:hypothetical protein